MSFEDLFSYTPIVITTRKKQVRKHRKARINKKWAKRYGYIEWDPLPSGRAMFYNNTIYMTQKDYDKLKEVINDRFSTSIRSS